MRDLRFSNLGVLFLALGLVGGPGAPSARAGAFIVEDGQPRAQIVIADHPPRTVKLAAAELQTYIRKISGATLPVTNAADGSIPVTIYVGRSPDTDRLRLSDDGLKYGAFKMVSGKDWLALLGHDQDFKEPPTYIRDKDGRPFYFEKWDALTGGKWANSIGWPGGKYNHAVNISDYDLRGSLNAVYEFLRRQGVRWYMAGDLGEVVPTSRSIALDRFDEVVRPDYPYRNCGGLYSPTFASGSRDAILWRMRAGLGEAPELLGIGTVTHGLINVHMRDKSHPEQFALHNGTRQTNEPFGWGTPCFSSPGFFDETLRYCRAYFRIYPDEKMLSLMPGDSLSCICECDRCKGKDAPERGAQGAMSDYVWGFINRVAIELLKTNPDRKVHCVAYGPYWLPPEKIDTLSPNVMVDFFNDRPGFIDPESRAKVLAVRQAWLKKVAPGNFFTGSLYLSSRPNIGTAGLPVYFPHIIAEDLRALKGLSSGEANEVTYGYDSDGQDMHAPGFNHLNVYVTARCYWDASQDIDALLDEYYQKFYGPAAREMKAFVEFSEKNWPLMQSKVEPIDKALALLAAARTAAGDTVYGKRIDLLVTFTEPMKKLRARVAVGRKDAPQAEAVERKDARFVLDGDLDKPFWRDVPEYELKELVTGKPAAVRTTFKAVWSDMQLLLAIRCEEPDMAGVTVATTRHDDFNLWNGDTVEVLLETASHAYYQLALNPAGTLVDLDRRHGALNSLWNSEAEVAARRGDTFWTLELRIPVSDNDRGGATPLKRVEGRKPTAAAPWYFNICRERRRNGTEIEDDAFSPTGKKSFGEPWKFGRLIVR